MDFTGANKTSLINSLFDLIFYYGSIDKQEIILRKVVVGNLLKEELTLFKTKYGFDFSNPLFDEAVDDNIKNEFEIDVVKNTKTKIFKDYHNKIDNLVFQEKFDVLELDINLMGKK
jgi:hypothetical protein